MRLRRSLSLLVRVVSVFGLDGCEVSQLAGLERSAVFEPLDPFSGGELKVVDPFHRPRGLTNSVL